MFWGVWWAQTDSKGLPVWQRYNQPDSPSTHLQHALPAAINVTYKLTPHAQVVGGGFEGWCLLPSMDTHAVKMTTCLNLALLGQRGNCGRQLGNHRGCNFVASLYFFLRFMFCGAVGSLHGLSCGIFLSLFMTWQYPNHDTSVVWWNVFKPCYVEKNAIEWMGTFWCLEHSIDKAGQWLPHDFQVIMTLPDAVLWGTEAEVVHPAHCLIASVNGQVNIGPLQT